MPSTATTRNRIEKQGIGENANTWGTKLNTDLDLLDDALDGVTSFSLSGSKTLSATNYATDEARSRVIDIVSGTGGTVTIPNVQKVYLVRNAASGSVTFTTGSGVTATVPTLTSTWIFSTGSNTVRSVDTADLWIYRRLSTNFVTSSSLAAETNIFISPLEVTADLEYEYEGTIYAKISSGSATFYWGWIAGLTDGIGEIRVGLASSQTTAAGGIPSGFSTAAVAIGSSYRPVFIRGHFIPSAVGTGNNIFSVAATGGTITIRAGSFIKFRRVYP